MMHPYVKRIAQLIENNNSYENKLKEIKFYINALKELYQSSKKIHEDLGKAGLNLKDIKIDDLNLLNEKYHDRDIRGVKSCDYPGDDMVTLLLRATEKGYVEIVRLLLDADVNPNLTHRDNISLKQYGRGFTALMAAAKNGNKEILQLLLAAGADLDMEHILLAFAFNFSQDEFRNALDFACEAGHMDIAELLKNHSKSVSTLEEEKVANVSSSRGTMFSSAVVSQSQGADDKPNVLTESAKTFGK